MKRFFYLLFALAFFLNACKEIPPVVTGSMGPVGPPPDVNNQQRQVLIEEFTGVRCVQCPAGSATIEDLLNLYGAQLIAVSIHAGEFSTPYSQSQYDFRTQSGDQILTYVGEPFGYPSAVVNRRKYEGEFDLQLGQNQWAGFIAQEKAVAPIVKIGIEPDFNPSNRNLDLKVTLYVQEDITDSDVRLSVLFTESGIQDLQLEPGNSNPNPDYVHKHVLRGMLTTYDGEAITEALTSGAEISKTYSYVLPAEWKEENVKVIAFVSLSGDDKDVLQAAETEVVE